jgi:2-polyprenyl-6-methoxyphenol hydroxylase-like FAD-dependent oxidoreductase
LGIVDRFLQRGQPLRLLSLYNQEMNRLFHISIGELDSRYPFMLSLSQHETERLLIEHLAALGIPIERRMRLAALRQDEQQVIARVYRAGSEEGEELRSAWLVGCDGAYSTVRGAVGLPFREGTYLQRVIQADVQIEWPLSHAADEIIGFVSAHGPLGVFPLPGEHQYRLLAFDSGLAPTLQTFQRLLDSCGPKGARLSHPVWMTEYAIQCRMTASFQAGRVFLAGDAAHTVSPATGQGMNSGMQDAYNLAWKLAMVHKGRGRRVLIDSYDEERGPVAAALLRVTDIARRDLEELLALYYPTAPALHKVLLRFVTELGLVQHRVARNLSMLDVGYHRSSIIGQNHSTRTGSDEEAGYSISLHDWLDFGNGPKPGDRAFDGQLLATGDTDGASPRRLFERFDTCKHTLMLFGGIRDTEEGAERLVKLGKWVRERYPEQVQCWLIQISPHPVPLAFASWDGPRFFDRNGLLHQVYGARGECLYLIRPDGYVGYRGQPADLVKLSDYLARIFT